MATIDRLVNIVRIHAVEMHTIREQKNMHDEIGLEDMYKCEACQKVTSTENLIEKSFYEGWEYYCPHCNAYVVGFDRGLLSDEYED